MLRALELFAGTGGIGLAFAAVARVVAAYDQDRAAGATFAHNHEAPVHALDLATVSARELDRHEARLWLLSPPCQPFTRRGRARDVADPRAAGLLRLVALLPVCRPERVLVENVEGFHGSQAHALLVTVLRALGLEVADVALCPSRFGAPVRRPRQFVLASRDGLGPLPQLPDPPLPAADFAPFLDPDPSPSLTVPERLRPRLLGCRARGAPLATITRSYHHAIRGAGPIVPGPDGPRYLSPQEILRLHAYPPGFGFPAEVDERARYRLAGNSVHVATVARLAPALALAGTGPFAG